MTANIDAMLRAAAAAVSANKKADARALLEKAIEIEEHNEEAWIELSKVVDTVDERKICLENILVINPANQYALNALQQLSTGNLAAAAAAAPSTPAFSVPEDDIFGGMEFDAQPDSAWSTGDDPWATPTSSASAVADTSYEASIPDDWAASIVKKPAVETYDEPISSGAFDGFDGDLFSAPSGSNANNPFGSDDPFGGPGDDFTVGDFGSTPFGGGAFSDDDFDSYTQTNSSPRPASPVMDEAFESAISEPVNDDFSELFTNTAPSNQQTYTPSDDDSDPAALFGMIPKEIRAGRMPGTDGALPGGTRALLVVSILMNIGALVFLVARVMGVSLT